MIGSSDVNLLRMNNKLVVNIGKMTYFGLLNFTNFVVGMMQKYCQSANTVHCFTYSTFQAKIILTVYSYHQRDLYLTFLLPNVF